VYRDSLQQIVKNYPKELLRLFLQDTPELLHALSVAVSSGDRLELRSAAHALKGAVSKFGARHPQALAAELEEIAPRCEMSQAQQLVDALAQEVFRLRSELAEIAQLA